MKLTIVRHGETIDNISGIVQGQTHSKLTKCGIKQAKLVGKRLRKEEFDLIISSDLGRAVQTTNEIVKYHPKTKVDFSQYLRELTSGIFDGKPTIERQRDRWRKKKNFYDYKPQGGESFHDLEARIKVFLKNLLFNHKEKNILIITHGRWAKIMLNVLDKNNRKKYQFLKILNTSVSQIEIDDLNRYNIVLLNCTKHLVE